MRLTARTMTLLVGILAIAIVFMLAGRSLFSGTSKDDRLNSHMIGYTWSRLRSSHMNIDQFAAGNPATLRRLVGEYWEGYGTNLPQEMTTNFFLSLEDDRWDRDMWGHAFNIRFRCVSNTPELLSYSTSIWSNGANGKDEGKSGDDISITWPDTVGYYHVTNRGYSTNGP